MITTYYGLDALEKGGGAFFAALVVGFFFGLALERAGFGSSRRISGIFYWTDMAVLKVMFTALVVAMLGLAVATGLGVIDPLGQIYFLKTYYGAYMVGGLIFGIGFVMSGWCPGTAAVGLASGKIDALVFLGGAVIGSVLFNELYPSLKPLYTWGASPQAGYGQSGVAFVYDSLGMAPHTFILLFTLAAVLCFWGSEYIEAIRQTGQRGVYLNSPFLKSFSLALLVAAAALPLLTRQEAPEPETHAVSFSIPLPPQEPQVPETALPAAEGIEPEALAALLLRGASDLVVVDVRSEEAYAGFHIKGAVNVQLPDLSAFMRENATTKMVVLYADSTTETAQARDALVSEGYGHVVGLNGGLADFLDKCLKPVSLRDEPADAQKAETIRAWRDYFLENRSLGS